MGISDQSTWFPNVFGEGFANGTRLVEEIAVGNHRTKMRDKNDELVILRIRCDYDRYVG